MPPDDPDQPPAPEEPLQVALEHAVRRWDAEVENASRYATRANGILALISAFLSLGLFKLGTLESVKLPLARAVVGVFLTLGIVWAFFALLELLKPTLEDIRDDPDGQQRPTASDALVWPPDEEPPFGMPEGPASAIVYNSLYEAAKELQDQNRAKKNRIDTAQRLLRWAAAYVVAAIVAYLLATALSPSLPNSQLTNQPTQEP